MKLTTEQQARLTELAKKFAEQMDSPRLRWTPKSAEFFISELIRHVLEG